MMKIFKVIKPGIFSSIQDRGRYGQTQYGVSQSGALDEKSYCWGNYLLNNPKNSASLEITIGQCQLLALTDTHIVVTGADLNFSINQHTAKIWTVLTIKQGDYLSWHSPINGMRAYLSILGGFKANSFLGSQSCNMRESIGSLLKKNDVLKQNKLKTLGQNKFRKMPRRFIPNYQKPLTLRLYLLNNPNFFNLQDQQNFAKQIQTISPKADRVAYQLMPQSIKPKSQTLYSEANSYGSVQITPNGTPIIMLKDMPTMGGYAKIGTVFSLDLSKLAQHHSLEKVSFEAVDIDTMQAIRRSFNQFFDLS